MLTIVKDVKNAFEVMMHNKMRSFLTMLGIVIGIATVIIVYAAGEGIYGMVLGQFESFGTDVIETEVKVPSAKKGMSSDSDTASAIARGVQITSLTIDDMEEIKKIKNVKDGYAALMSQEQANYRDLNYKVYVLGVSPSYINIDKGSKVEFGRFFDEGEDKSLSQVIVLGKNVKSKLFGDEDAIGKYISIRHQKYQVIGIMKERGGSMFMNFDDYVYLPVRTLQKKVMGIDYLMYTMHQLKDTSLADDTAEEARYVVRRNHKITNPDKDDFRIVTMTEGLDSMKTAIGGVTLLLLGIVVISLIVGGVGIMNVMYVVVSERTMEIGLRKAVGARTADILRMFLVESVIITIIGGAIGIACGVGAAYVIAWAAKNLLHFDWRFGIPLKAYIVSLVFSAVCGVFFGLYPAKKAAGLSPIEAIRNE